MFNPQAKISSRAEHDRLLRLHAIDEAGALFRKHGGEAVAIASVGLLDPSKTAEERRYDRLMIVEIERLDRLRLYGPSSTTLAIWKPPLFSHAWFGALLRSKRGRPLR